MKASKERIVLPVLDTLGKEVEKIELDPKVFDGRVSKGSLYRSVHNYLRNKRSGTASTKTRAEVSGGGKKPWRQKGTGRARVGSSRNPIWTKGGIVFGPRPRDFRYQLPKKIKKLALKSSLNDSIISSKMVILNTLVLENAKTKTFVKVLENLKLKDKLLVVLGVLDENIVLSSRNVASAKLVNCKDLNAFDVLSCKKVLITKDALHVLTKRLK